MLEHELTYGEAAALYDRLESRAAGLRRPSAFRVRPRRRWELPAIGLGLVAVAALLGALILAGSRSDTHTTNRGKTSHQDFAGIRPAPIGKDPFGDAGRRVAPGRASRIAGFAVPMPSATLANPSNLSAVWYNPAPNGSGTKGEVILDFITSQVRISIHPANTILATDAPAAFAKMAKSLHVTPGVLEIGGSPALVQGGGRDDPGFAEFVRDGVVVAVMGQRSAADLVTIAETLTTQP